MIITLNIVPVSVGINQVYLVIIGLSAVCPFHYHGGDIGGGGIFPFEQLFFSCRNIAYQGRSKCHAGRLGNSMFRKSVGHAIGCHRSFFRFIMNGKSVISEVVRFIHHADLRLITKHLYGFTVETGGGYPVVQLHTRPECQILGLQQSYHSGFVYSRGVVIVRLFKVGYKMDDTFFGCGGKLGGKCTPLVRLAGECGLFAHNEVPVFVENQ